MSTPYEKLVAEVGEEAAKEEMRRRGANSKRNLGGQGGFAKLKAEDPEKFKEITSKGGKSSKRG